MRVFDRRIRPFLFISTCLQSARGTTVVTLGFFLGDALQLGPEETVRAAGVGFVVLAAAGLLGQLVIVQRLRPSAGALMRWGCALNLAAFLVLVVGGTFFEFLVALGLLGVGLGVLRPGASAAASLSVEANEQGAAAGILGGVSVAGNIFGPLIGTAVYEVSHDGPYLLNAAMMAASLLLVLTNRRVRSVRA
jgi:MFS family permease